MKTASMRPLAPLLHLDEELVQRHQQGLWRYLRYLGADPSTADDLVQESFLTILRSPPEDRGDAATAAWLRTVARNLFLSRGRQLRRELELVEEAELESAWLALAGDEVEDAGDDYLHALEECLEGLGERHRRALELRYADGASRRAMAVALDVGEEGVKTMLRRLRDVLQECVENKTEGER